jgi:general secretion pathway protein D
VTANKHLTKMSGASAITACLSCVLAGTMALTTMCISAVAFGQRTNGTDQNPVIRTYQYNGDVEAMAARLQSELSAVPSVRIVGEAKSSQIVVVAPEVLQSLVAERLGAASAPNASKAPAAGLMPTPALAGQPTPAATVGTEPKSIKTATVTPQNANIRQIEDSLVNILGKRISLTNPSEPGARSYQVAIAGGDTVRFDFLPQQNRISIRGSGLNVNSGVQVIEALDSTGLPAGQVADVIPLRNTSAVNTHKIVEAIQAANNNQGQRGPVVTEIFPKVEEPQSKTEPQAKSDPQAKSPVQFAAATPGAAPAGAEPATGTGSEGNAALIGNVSVQAIEGFDLLIFRGDQRDVTRLRALITQIEALSVKTEPVVEIYFLKQVEGMVLTNLLYSVYDPIFYPRHGDISITPLVKPNALLLVGRKENVELVITLIQKLDQPVPPDTQFQVFRLKHQAAATAVSLLTDFYTTRGQLGTQVRITGDYRTNSVVIQAQPRDMAEIADLIARIDTNTSETRQEIRIIQVKNSLSDEIVQILQNAVLGAARAGGGTTTGGGAAGGAGSTQAASANQKSNMLQFMAIDEKSKRLLTSGILTEVQFTSANRSNAIVVTADPDSMELIEAIIYKLDNIPPAQAELKVFTIVNGDATNLATMLQNLLSTQNSSGAVPVQTAAAVGETTLVTLRFAVDTRTNSIIASGTMGDLQVVEAILLRLDEGDLRKRKSIVYRLKNAPATDVANAINTFLTSDLQVQTLATGLVSAYELVQREVVVVAEPVSNSLIVSATSTFYEEIKRIIEELDARPPMVMITVMIASIDLGQSDEFGVQIGLQDSILFQRASASGNNLWDFIGQGLGTGNPAGTENYMGTQGYSALGLANTAASGIGGFVFNLSNQNLRLLLRATTICHRTEVLSRPTVMTMDNQPAFIQVGARVPRISGTTTAAGQVTNSITLDNVGVILGVTPRISPDGLVVMYIDAENSSVGPEATGIPVSTSSTGAVVRSPIINTTMAQTTVSALSGQTIVLGGLITRNKGETHAKVPWVGDIPFVGRLFRYDTYSDSRQELLIIMTPYIIRSEQDMDAMKREESARMHWCLSDVLELHGRNVSKARATELHDDQVPVIYPDKMPTSALKDATSGPDMSPSTMRIPSKQSTASPAIKGSTVQLLEPPAEPRLPPPPESSGSATTQRSLNRDQLQTQPTIEQPYYAGGQQVAYQRPAAQQAQAIDSQAVVVPVANYGTQQQTVAAVQPLPAVGNQVQPLPPAQTPAYPQR